MSATFRIRKSLFGKSILQKLDTVNGVTDFRDVPYQPVPEFSLVPRTEWAVVTKRIAAADKRAQQRRDKAAREGTPFVDSRMADDAT